MAVDFLGALGAGSDIDTTSLVESLVAAERTPKETAINSKIDKVESTISAYGEVLSTLSSLETAFGGLNDAKDFADYTVDVTGNETATFTTAFTVSATTDIEPGTVNSVSVTAIATTERWLSGNSYLSENTAINDGNAFDIVITDADSNQTTIAITGGTVASVAQAINDQDLGITARVVDTGASPNAFVISLEATTAGTPSAFTVTSTDTQSNTLGFAQLSAATNAQMTVNGINIERSSNTVDDVIEGATLNLIAPTSGTATISVTRNNEGIKARIATLVDAYNTAKDKFSDLMTVGGSNQNSGVLSGDGTMRFVAGRVKDLFTGISSTATDNIAYLNDIGVSFTRYGLLEIDEDRLDAALNDNYTDVVSMLSADTDNQSNFGVADRGLAGDAIVTIRDLMANDGALLRATASLEARADDYADALADLELRMESLRSRYLAQFTAMETAIDQINSTKDYLTNALEGLPFNNRNK